MPIHKGQIKLIKINKLKQNKAECPATFKTKVNIYVLMVKKIFKCSK